MKGKYEFFGNIYEVDVNGVVYGLKGKPLKQKINEDGYYEVTLCGKETNIRGNKIRYKVKVHTIVAKTFLSKPDSINKYEVNHKDCCRTNNKLDNLEWLTHTDNIRYSIKCGNFKKIKCNGEDNFHSKLKKDDVLRIRKLYSEGYSIREIYRKFYRDVVSECSIGNICKYRTWENI